MRKRIVVLADMHCGHRVGLTAPEFQLPIDTRWGFIQYQLWNSYEGMINRLKPIDYVFVNGDSIDGKGNRSGGTELLTSDRKQQARIAARAILYCEAEKVIMSHGTPYHVGQEEDWEEDVAEKVNAVDLGSHTWPKVNGIVFDLKHHIAGSSVPYGKGTQIGKDRLWNLLWAEHEEQPKAQILIRSHVHSFFFCGEDHWLGIVTPALQGLGSKFGSRKCVQHVDFGLVYFDIEEDGTYSWGWDIAKVSSQRATTLEL